MFYLPLGFGWFEVQPSNVWRIPNIVRTYDCGVKRKVTRDSPVLRELGEYSDSARRTGGAEVAENFFCGDRMGGTCVARGWNRETGRGCFGADNGAFVVGAFDCGGRAL